MNASLKNLAGLFRDTRTRTIIIFTGAILVFAIVIGLIRFFSQTAPSANVGAQVGGGPGSIQSIPGGFDRAETEEYARLQQQQNITQAQIAARQGGSAVPTLIRSSAFVTPTNCAQCCNCPGVTGEAGIPVSQSSPLGPGSLVYDAQGKVIGTLGPDGKVRNANGIVVGGVGPDGLVRDANGNVIGSVGATATGTPVYDAQGRLIGTIGADGKVRDVNGNIIGTVGPDGVVRDANGVVIGKAGATATGTPVYDAQGRLIGTVSADGKVRDANGNIVGTVGADGVVRDANGNIIGKAIPKPVAGTPVYDSQGRLVGVVGADGKVRDANGNIIGTVGPDGVVRDANGNIIGRAGPTKPGTPVYDAQGRLVGVIGADGKMRDANGKVIGTVGLDGVVRDAEGNILGSTTPPTAAAAAVTSTALAAAQPQQAATQALPALGAAENPQLQSILQRQAAQVSAQKAEQFKQQMQGVMSAQANQLLTSWVSPVQQYVAGQPSSSAAGAGGVGGRIGTTGGGTAPPAVKAGTVMFGVLITAVNSDQPGPVLATIVEGKFKGGKLIGSLTNQGETVLLSFNTLTLPNVPTSISINSVAIDEHTARTSFSSHTDHHYWLRYGTLFASSFLQGYAQAVLTTGTTVTSTGLSTQSTVPDLSPAGKFMVALGNVGTRYSSVLGNVFSTPPTVYVNSGTAMGILFLSDVPALPTA